MKARLARVIRAGKTLARTPDLPRWLRCVLVFAVLPIPGPVDEAALVVAVGLALIFYRPVLARAWQQAGS